MTREMLIEEYTRLLGNRKVLLDEVYELEGRIRLLRDTLDHDQEWLEAIEARFDRVYGCNSEHRDSVRHRLGTYIQRGEEVPE